MTMWRITSGIAESPRIAVFNGVCLTANAARRLFYQAPATASFYFDKIILASIRVSEYNIYITFEV